MEQKTTINVWNEIRVTGDGISVSLYSEDETGATVEDEVRLPFEDLQDEMTGDILSLGLSDSTKESLVGNDGQSDNASELGPEVGDIVIDPESGQYSDGRVLVTEVTNTPCSEYSIEKINGCETTVADENIGHPIDSPVIMGEYVDGSSKEYAFPLTRLKPVS